MADAYRISGIESEFADVLRRGVELHRMGRLEEAERVYRAVLAHAPTHVNTLHLLGVLLDQRGETVEALSLLAAALEANPTSAEIWTKYGVMLDSVGLSAEALAAYDKALIIHPSDVGVLFNRGAAQMRLGRFQQAAKSFGEVVAIQTDHLGALGNLGAALRILGFREEALANFSKALAIRPDDLSTLNNCGLTLQDLDRHDEALSCFDKVLAAKGDQLDTICHRARSLHALGRLREALMGLEAALAIDPHHEQSLMYRGGVLRDMGRVEQAMASYDAVLAHKPDHAEALWHRGQVLADMWRSDEAVGNFNQAIAIDPRLAGAFNARGLALARLRRYDEALASHAQALAIEPENAEFNLNEGIARLRSGDFAAGWAKYEWRLRTKSALVRQFGSPSWRGESSLRGRTILLYAEQDIAETLLFVRYLPLLADTGARVVLEVQPELKELLDAAPGSSKVIVRGEKPPTHDVNCPLASLPYVLATTLERIPAKVPYVRAQAKRKLIWAERFARITSHRVGIAWTDQVETKRGRDRSIPLGSFLPLLDHPRVRFVSLQSGAHRIEASLLTQQANVIDAGADLKDFDDVAAEMAHMDLVVTVDGPIAHLAGAMGKKVWILLPFDADFYWMADRDDSPWYPTARLFRQSSPGDWDGVIASVRQALINYKF
jgi:tetratricopeptide (TPR) repeat protein